MIKNIFIFFLLLSLTSYGQVKLEGIVKDSLKVPLESASLVAIDQKTNNLESYVLTDIKGKYKLNLKNNSNYKIQVSYIGLRTINETLDTKEADILKDFVLRSDIALDEVIVKMPVVVRGDTLIYDADSFKNGSERKLEDIIDKLPGVEINESGQIEVEGKVVNKLMVNGKDFFDGDTKIGTKNIPSSAVDKIQVLRNYAEVGQLSGVRNNQNNFAINIKLKQGKESFWFGNVTAGAGDSPDEKLYLVQPKLFYYNPKYSINFISDLNNIGEVALSRRDIRGFGGGFNAPSRQSGTSINLGDNSLNFLTNQRNALKIENKLATMNFSYSPKKSLDLSGFLIYNNSRILSNEFNRIQYTNSDLGIPDEATEQSNTELSNQRLLKLSASYKPNGMNQVDYDILARISNDSQTKNNFSSILGNTDQLDEVTPFSINQNLSYYYTLDENNIFAFAAQNLIKNENPFYNAVLENNSDELDPFDSTASALGLDTSRENYNLSQNKKILSNQLDAKLDYYHIINPKSNINLTLGTLLSRQKFNSNIFQFLTSGSDLQPIPLFNNGLAKNDIEYTFTDVYLGAHYRFKTGIFTFTPGFSVHAYGNKNIQFGETVSDKFLKVLPDFETRIQLKKGESLTFNYNMRNQFTDVTRLARGLVFNDYNSLQYGEPDLQNALSHNLSLLYSSFNLFNYTNVFARASYSNNIDQIRGLTNFENVIRTSTFFNSNFADENFNIFGRIQRTFGKVRASLNTNFNYSKINQFIQDRQSLNERFTQTFTPGIRTNFKVAPNISLRYRYSITNNIQGSRETKFITTVPSLEFDAFIVEKFTFKTNYSLTTQDQVDGESESFQIWEATLSYRKDKDAKWEYELKGTNLLNVDSQVRNNANNISVFNSVTFIQPRFLTFRVVYQL
ncbi:carboxypeptidase-like regulatory domain-containing protein [Flavobacteriaceae bacterium]|nr:carboxypeptidase-like regulatory domain-containing protein [Flavobacteriaceae bacterium]MDB4255430.1 carboxypeptidase-like regulatory domain-containing protein [Flavobacteriaceae bacterium]